MTEITAGEGGAPAEAVEDAWAAIEERMDAVVREDYRDFSDRHYRRLPADVVERIQVLHADGTSLPEIATLLEGLGQRPVARRDRAWSGFTVRVVLAIAADPDLRARLVEPSEAHAA